MIEFIYEQKIDGANSEKITDTLYTNRANLEAIFRMMDLDSNGLISMDEFKEACTLLSGKFDTLFLIIFYLYVVLKLCNAPIGYLPNCSVDQLLDNCRMMDMNKDSLVDLNEFLEAFRLCQLQTFTNPSVITTAPDNDTSLQNNDATEKNEAPFVDQYEINEMIESFHKGGKLKKSSSIRSVVSIESLGSTGLEQINLEAKE